MTIYALSTGPGVSGLAVIRVSGKDTRVVINKITGKVFQSQEPRLGENSTKLVIIS